MTTYTQVLQPGDSMGITAALPPSPPPPPLPSFPGIQKALDAAVSGSTIVAPTARYPERIVITKPVTLILGTATAPAVVDGTGLGIPLQQPLLSIEAPHVTVQYGETTGSGGAGIGGQNGGSGALIVDHYTHHNVQEGWHGSSVPGFTWLRVRSMYNDVSHTTYSGGEQGAGKLARCTGWTFDSCEAAFNGGPGIWADIYCKGTTYRNNLVHDNWGEGILHEASWDALIDSNVGYHNGLGITNWGWGAFICVSSSSGASGLIEIRNNVGVWNRATISLIAQSRAADYPDIKPYANLYVHDNTLIQKAAANIAGWYEPDVTKYPTAIFTNARSDRNRYSMLPASDHLAGETNASVLLPSDIAAILAQYALPAS